MAIPASDRRRRSRIAAMILCELRTRQRPTELMRVRDLSEWGLKLATSLTLPSGERVSVRLPGGGDWVRGEVIWCSKGAMGVSFSRAAQLPNIPGCSGKAEPEDKLSKKRVKVMN